MAADDLNLVIDALDAWLQMSPTVVARRFLEFDVDLLVAAERNCFPNNENSVRATLLRCA